MAKTKILLSSDAITDKWTRNMKNSTESIKAGINAMTESPAEKAIEKKDKMIQNLTAAVQDGRWEKGMRSVTLASWKDKVLNKGISRIAAGVDQAQEKRKKFDSWMVNKLNTVLPEIHSMPDMTLQENIERSRRMIEFMAQNKYKTQK